MCRCTEWFSGAPVDGAEVVVRVELAWWFRWYLSGVIVTALITGAEPDLEKVRRVVKRAARVRPAR